MSDDTETLKEILRWIKIVGMKNVKEILESTLNTNDKKLIYQHSDGSRGLLNFKDISDLGKDAIARYWRQWSQIGIVEMKSVKGGNRAIKSFDLEEMGIEIPDIKIRDKQENNLEIKEDNFEEQTNLKNSEIIKNNNGEI